MKKNKTSIFLKRNYQIIYAIILILLIPLTIVLNTIWSVKSFKHNIDIELQREAVLIANLFNTSVFKETDNLVDLQEKVINIGEATAERIKQEIGAAYPQKEIREIDVRGRNLAEGVPRAFTLNSNEILEALQEPLSMIVQSVKSALELCPPELASDIAETGMVLTGGGALLRDLDILFSEETGLPVIVAEDPMTCVARGGGKALELMDATGNEDLLSTE